MLTVCGEHRQSLRMADLELTDIAAEVFTKGRWQPVSLELALKLHKERLMRWPECHGKVKAHAASKGGMRAHMEHYDRNEGCSRGDYFDGTPKLHPRALK